MTNRCAFVAEAKNRPKSAHRYNIAKQQLIYKSEIARIWKVQSVSLSCKDEPQLTDDEDNRKSLPPQHLARRESCAFSPATALMGGPAAAAAAALTGFSHVSSVECDQNVSIGPDGRQQVLRIKHFIDSKWCIEIVQDAAVICAYIQRRQIIGNETMDADTVCWCRLVTSTVMHEQRNGVPLFIRCRLDPFH